MDAITAWLKVIHISALVVWCAGLFYLPTMFAAHPATREHDAFRRLRAMTRVSFVGIASPAAVIAIASGSALIPITAAAEGWLFIKLTIVTLMVAFHVWCGELLAKLRTDAPDYRSGRLLLLTVVPVFLIPAVLWLVLHKPPL
jgi:protoporphyrinogen IX oxidase